MSSCNKWFTGLNRTFIPLKVLSLAENIPFLSLHHACCNYSYTAVTDNLLCHHLSPAITNLFYKPHYRIWLLPRIIYLWRSHQQNLKYNRAPIVNAFHHRRAHPTSKSTIWLFRVNIWYLTFRHFETFLISHGNRNSTQLLKICLPTIVIINWMASS